ncbi:uncharacterized protein LOC131662349 [Vicia villosa]|uniref:uncharacterized protein LOC131662349 n=1 Tax=Vicia villosa TaxID=3911 RepID=UPI00273C4789|nr:uncharacterized protein LOC131662349 [Vicia villosa]
MVIDTPVMGYVSTSFTIIFPETGAKEDVFLSAKQVDEFVQDSAELFILLATLDVHEKRTIEEFPIVCDFAEGVLAKDEFEKSVLGEVISPSEIGSCKGILLFGPPSTGKTMLAKTMATEPGENFINISLSKVTSKYHEDTEKYVEAVFSVDRMLGKRVTDSNNSMYNGVKTKNLAQWDSLSTKEENSVLVLAATNGPFDFDEAVVRRLPRRYMLNLLDAANCEKILKVILGKEQLASDVNLTELTNRTESYYENDLKYLCMEAAHIHIREILEKEKQLKVSYSSADIRPLKMNDFSLSGKEFAGSDKFNIYLRGSLLTTASSRSNGRLVAAKTRHDFPL